MLTPSQPSPREALGGLGLFLPGVQVEESWRSQFPSSWPHAPKPCLIRSLSAFSTVRMGYHTGVYGFVLSGHGDKEDLVLALGRLCSDVYLQSTVPGVSAVIGWVPCGGCRAAPLHTRAIRVPICRQPQNRDPGGSMDGPQHCSTAGLEGTPCPLSSLCPLPSPVCRGRLRAIPPPQCFSGTERSEVGALHRAAFL